jgi:alkylhydroperoxidase family enzyme
MAGRVGERELRALPEYADSDVFTDDEKLVLDYAAAMSRTPAEVDDGLWARLRARFDEPQIVELTATIAIENLRARFNNALAIEPQGFSEGAFCVVPSNKT